MPPGMPDAPLEIFSTCPASSGAARETYARHAVEAARWSEEAGCKGILVYADNSQIDPWLVAQLIIEHTRTLSPLVAVQPVYMHPYTVAKMVTSFGFLYGRQVYLNMVAGGFKNDLSALNDPTPHDRRYDRLIEYTTVITRLLAGASPVSFEGEFYRVDKLRLTPPLPPELFPGIFISGSSEAGLVAARETRATAVKYPKPASEEEAPADDTIDFGIRVGIIARQDEESAWEIARARFPEDRKGQLTHQVAMKVSDSAWHGQLSAIGGTAGTSPYWLGPFQNYQAMCPYLVGSYGRVGEELARYISLGYRRFILDIPPDAGELAHVRMAFDEAREVLPWRSCCKS